MISIIWKPFLLFLIIINAISWSLAAIFPEISGVSWPYTMSLLFIINALSFFIFQKSTQKDSKTSTLMFLALTTGKMLLGMIYVLVLVLAFKISSLQDMLYFVSLYFLFLALEVIVFIKMIKFSTTKN